MSQTRKPDSQEPLRTAALGEQTPEIRDLPPPEGWRFTLSGASGAFELKTARTVIGRDGDVALDHASVSRRHAVIEIFSNEMIQVRDLASTNGTRLKGELVESGKLRSGDAIRFGDLEFVFGVEKLGG